MMTISRLHPSVTLGSAETSAVVGDIFNLMITTVPNDATVTWTSSDAEVASVMENSGTITALTEGTTVITASITVDGTVYSDFCTVTVTES